MGLALAFVWLLLARAAHAGEEFPPFLPGASEFPPDVRSEIISVWTDYTLTRGVEGRPARAPLATYRLFAGFYNPTPPPPPHPCRTSTWGAGWGAGGLAPPSLPATFSSIFQTQPRPPLFTWVSRSIGRWRRFRLDNPRR